jgi:hypothetical protein
MSKVGVDDFLRDGPAGGARLDDLPRVPLWPVLAPEALYGLPGRIVETIQPHTEADPVATLAHLLVGIGNLIGAGPHARVENDAHCGRLYAVLVGKSSKARKGLAWSAPKALLRETDDIWVTTRVRSGLSSGEGLIYQVRDARDESQAVREKGRVVDYQQVRVDDGEPDKRLLVFEPELASVLRRMNSETNSLSAVLRDAWDHGILATLTKNSPLRATGAHISLMAHITQEELSRELTATERANGFANRFLFFLVRRSKVLPEGGSVPAHALKALADEMRDVVAWARTIGEVPRDPATRDIWAEIYPRLSHGEPGMVGAILARAEAHVLRLSVLYAVLDRSPLVRPPHLMAALAVWDHAEASARRIFGSILGDPTADVILETLRARGPLNMSQIHALFKRNKPAHEIQAALNRLAAAGKVRSRTESTGGRPVQIWEAV